MKHLLETTLLATAFYLSACHFPDEKHIYKDDSQDYICFEESTEKMDRFILKSDHKDYDEEDTKIVYRGDFIKDSVDQAVGRYLKTGSLPLKSDLY